MPFSLFFSQIIVTFATSIARTNLLRGIDMESKLIARERECAMLTDCLESDRSEFVIVYGRRRVGKTFLVDQYFKMTYDFSFVGAHKSGQKVQLHNFAKAMKKYAALKSMPRYVDWFEAFDALEEHLESLPPERKKVVFFDEMPWIDTQKSDFVEALENFWNGWANRRGDIVFIGSGSATSWMVDNIVENQGGLHARITANIYLRPFTLGETEEYLRRRNFKWDRYQIAQCYMFFGGIPFYLSLLKKGESLAQNVDRLCFAQNAALRIEFDELYNALFTHSEHYIAVVQALSKHKEGMTRNEIMQTVKLNGEKLSKVLRNLERCDFIAKMARYPNKSTNCIYRLVDFYTLFYYKFIAGDLSGDEKWWSNNFRSHNVEAWTGRAFELLCLRHTSQIKAALGIASVATTVSTWRMKADSDSNAKGAQIDLIIDRADRIVHLCEIKFCTGPYELKKDYEQKIRERMSLFTTATKCRKTVVNTFITTFGVADGLHKSIVDSEVKLDALFT